MLRLGRCDKYDKIGVWIDGTGKNSILCTMVSWASMGWNRAHLGQIDRKWNLEKLHVNTVSIVVKFGLSRLSGLNQHS